MAKSARASIKKSNRTKLRARVFRPVEDARTERLSAKLVALASQPKPERLDLMELEHTTSEQSKSEKLPNDGVEDMDIDDGANPANTTKKSARSKNPNRIHKKRHRKASANMTFATARKGRKTGAVKKGKR